jgi:hypothetical protein
MTPAQQARLKDLLDSLTTLIADIEEDARDEAFEETWPIYQQVVQQPRVIEGVTIQFPADFKRYLPDGTNERVARL